MYRLLNPRFTSLRKFPVFSSYYYEQNFEVRSPACLQIQPDYCLACARFQSTVINPNAFQKKIRKRGKKKKYSDLVVVTDGSTKQQKARIKNLTWADLQTLAATNLSLGELYKLEDLSRSHTYSNLTVIDNIPGNSEVIEENQVDVIPEQIEALDETEAIEEDIDPDLEEAVDEVETETSKKLSHQVGIRTLASFVGVCTSNNTPMKGLYALIFHNCRASRGTDNNFIAIKNVKVYNTLLKGFAAKSDITRVEEVLKMMKEENVKPNAQTYVQILECYGRVNAKDQYLKQIRIYAKEAVTNGVNFDRIMNEGVFLKDERKVVLAALRKVDPKYEPLYWKPVLQYNNHLVDHLNHDSQLCQPSEKNDAGGTVRNFTPEFMDKVIKQQLQMEKQGFMSVKNIENRGEATDDVIRYRAIFQEHLRNWEETATKAFERDLAAQTAKKSPLNFEAYLRSIPTKDFVSIIVAEARNMAQGSETYSPTVTFLHRDMGHKVYFRFQVLRKQKAGVLDKVIDVHTKYCHEYARPSVAPSDGGRLNPRQRWQWIEHERVAEGATLKMDDVEWTPAILKSLGEFLYRIVMHDLKVDVNAMRTNSRHRNYLPAFYTVFRSQGRIVKEEVKPHPFLCKLYRSSMPENLSFPAYELPMYCPPVPWTGPHNGSYLVSPCDLLRLPPQASLQKKRIKEMDVRGLYPSLDALNQLAAVPWRVNRATLDVILEVFRGGGSARLDVPETPENLTPPPAATPDMDKAERFRLFKQRLQYKRKKSEMYSLWCDCLYKLSLANHFRDDVFWLPHNMDFRGRVYPVPPHLTHLGSDLSRSMLVFAESRPLGPDGLDWLKIHLVNLTGLKKRNSTQERLDYANSITEEIFDSADRPLKGRKWWAESDEPWQTLACCMEIVKAVRSGDPENYRTHFPIHQDGSCNGLQHYAALGRDEGGGHSVNLCPSAVPQDVYGAVVALVEEQRRIDAMLGSEIAKLLEGFVKRKVIKQTIMTTVYGVTRFGARLQIARQLKDIEDFPKDAVWNASSYLTVKTFESLRTMFTSTREIQDWFTECARAIAVSGQQVEWITPLGLPIVQPYSKYKALNNNAIVYKSYHIDQFEKPNVMKQKNAFPPNFIHSLDSSHMMLTSLHCEREGITFVSVHDCYWTHPSSVHIMNKICREQFVALHSEPILEDLSMFLTEKYSYSNEDFYHDGSVNDSTKKKLNRVLRKLPPKGDLDINRVLYSVYFFS